MSNQEANESLVPVTDYLNASLENVKSKSPFVVHPLWNYCQHDVLPLLKWSEFGCNSSKILGLIERLVGLPPITFAFGAFGGLCYLLQKSLKAYPRLTANLLTVLYPVIATFKSIESSNLDREKWMAYCMHSTY